MAFKHSKNKKLILTEMIVYGIILGLFLWHMIPLGLL